jgi:hypothetical protein
VTFFTEDGFVDPNKPTEVKITADSIVMIQTISEYAPKPIPQRVLGILQSPQHWLPSGKTAAIIVNAALKNSPP